MHWLVFDVLTHIVFWGCSTTSGDALVVSSRKEQSSVKTHQEDRGVQALNSRMRRQEPAIGGGGVAPAAGEAAARGDGGAPIHMSDMPAMRDTTLFCWAVLFPNKQELDLARTHIEKGMLAKCDAFAIYSNVSSGELSKLFNLSETATSHLHIEKVIDGPMEGPIGGVWKTVQNWPIFEQVWQQRSIQFAEYDWTIKVDLDTVFSTGRLRNLLAFTSFPGDKAVTMAHKREGRYRQKVFGSFNGPIEIFSQKAISRYIDGHQDCEVAVQNGEEDWYMEKCMKLLGVENIVDFRILLDLNVENKSSVTYDLQWEYVPSCAKNYVAFHPVKDVASMARCMKEMEQ